MARTQLAHKVARQIAAAAACAMALCGCDVELAIDTRPIAPRPLRIAADCRTDLPGDQGCSDGGCGCWRFLDERAVGTWLAQVISDSCGESGVESFDGWRVACNDGSETFLIVTRHEVTPEIVPAGGAE